jgi:polysaccharide chain length determinant protein (PEP-CTERM system associated)
LCSTKYCFPWDGTTIPFHSEGDSEQEALEKRKGDGMTGRELTPADYLAMLRRRWVLILALTLVGGPLAYGVSRYLPDRYKSTTLVLVQQPSIPREIVNPLDTTDIGQRLASMQQQILSRTRLEPIIRQFGLYPADINRVSIEELVWRLQKSIDVNPLKPMDETRAREMPGFYVSVTMDSPRSAQQVCTAVTSMFIEENLRLRQQHSEDTTQFLVQQLADAKAKLDEQDGRLAAFKTRYLGIMPDEEKTNLNLLMSWTSQLDAATQALARAQQDKTFAESMLTQQIGAWQAAQSGRSPETMDQQLAMLQIQLANLQSRYTDDYPDVMKTKNDIAALKKKIAENEEQKKQAVPDKSPKSTVEPQQVAQLRAQIHNYDQVIAEKTRAQDQIKQQIKVYQDRVQSSPIIEQQFKELTRDHQTALDFYNDLLRKRDQSAMATDLEHHQEGEQFRVLDPANLPTKPSFPNRPVFALQGFGGGLAMGLVIAFLLEMKDSSIRTERDVEFTLHLPVLAMIPEIAPLSGQRPDVLSEADRVEAGVGAGGRA